MHKYHKSCSQLIWPFYGLLQLYELKIQKTRIFESSVQKYHKSCVYLILPFYGLLRPFELRISENSSLREVSAQVSQIVFLASLTVLRLFTTVWV